MTRKITVAHIKRPEIAYLKHYEKQKQLIIKKQFICVKNDPKEAWKKVNKILNHN